MFYGSLSLLPPFISRHHHVQEQKEPDGFPVLRLPPHTHPSPPQTHLPGHSEWRCEVGGDGVNVGGGLGGVVVEDGPEGVARPVETMKWVI